MNEHAETASRFGERLLSLRKERGWSQPKLGEAVGTLGDIIGRYERGDMTPSVEVARRLARALGVTVDYLVGDHDLPGALKDPQMLDRWNPSKTYPRRIEPRPHPLPGRRAHPGCQDTAGVRGVAVSTSTHIQPERLTSAPSGRLDISR